MPFPQSRSTSFRHSSIVISLINYCNNYPEAAAGSECNGMSTSEHPLDCSCNISATQTVLGTSLFPSSIQGVITFKALQDMEPSYLRNYFVPITSTCPTQ